jgi:hypothetical protein
MANRQGIWITQSFLDDQSLSLAKVMTLSEVVNLTKTSECYASNAHFAHITRLSIVRVSNLISELHKDSYLSVFYQYQGKRIKQRTITYTPFTDAPPPFAGDKGNSKSNNKLNTTTLAPLNLDQVNDYAIQKGLTSVNTFRFYNTYKKTGWLSVNGNPIDWRERLREWDIDDAKNKQQNKGSTPTGSYKSLDPFTIYDYDEF